MADGMLDRLGASLRALVGVYGPNAGTQAHGLLTGILPGGRGELSPRGTTEFLKAYSESPWLRAVVQKVAHSVATTEWQLYVETSKPGAGPATGKAVRNLAYQRDSDWRRRAARRKDLESTGSLKQIDSHPMLDLLNSTNPFLTGLSTRQLTQVYLDLVGEVFWLKERKGKNGPPVAIWPLPPTWVYTTPTPDRPFFEVRFRGWQVEIPETEILWMADPNPLNPYGRGSGMTHALGDELDTDEFAARHTKLWFQNRARPDLLIAMEGANPEEVKRLEQDWLSKSQGFWRAFKPYFLSGKGNVTIKELSQTFGDMQLIQLRQFERDMIMQVYGVSPEIMGVLANSNRATITAADYMFARWVLTPRLEFQRAFLQERLAPEFDERLIVDYASPIQRDQDYDLAVATAAPYALTVDEWRDLQHLPPLPKGQGKVHMVPSSLTAIEDISQHAPPPPSLFGVPNGPPGALPGGKPPAQLGPGQPPPTDGSQPDGQQPPKAASLAARAQWAGVARVLQKAQGHDGFVVALWLPAATAAALALPDGEPPDQLHCTLAYCGPYRHLDVGALGDVLAALDALAADSPPLSGTISGYGRFQGSATSDGQDVFYGAVDVPGLAELRQAIVATLAAHDVPASTAHGFTPHVTLAYLPPDAPSPVPTVANLPLHFDAVTLGLGDTHLSVPLLGAATPAAGIPLLLPARASIAPPVVREAHPAPSPAEVAAARAWWRETVAPAAPVPAALLDARPVNAPPAGRGGKAVSRFSPDQPRDDQGRWTDGGGSSAPAAAPAPTLTEAALHGHDSLAKYTRADGTLEPARQALHDRIVGAALAGVPGQQNPTAYFVGGGPAAGKSTMLNSGAIAVAPRGLAAYVEADEIKMALPEMQAGLRTRDPNIAGYVHEESAAISKRIRAEAMDRRADIVHDAIHNTSLAKVEQTVRRMRAEGYRVEAAYATVPVETARARAQARGEATGRFIPLDALTSAHKGVASMFPALLSHHVFDRVSLYETAGAAPRLLASQVDGRTTIHEPAGYAAFLARGQ
jgi:2'-5' RNA ligase/phage portal protein BeeE